jgi:hypothetical protein
MRRPDNLLLLKTFAQDHNLMLLFEYGSFAELEKLRSLVNRRNAEKSREGADMLRKPSRAQQLHDAALREAAKKKAAGKCHDRW